MFFQRSSFVKNNIRLFVVLFAMLFLTVPAQARQAENGASSFALQTGGDTTPPVVEVIGPGVSDNVNVNWVDASPVTYSGTDSGSGIASHTARYSWDATVYPDQSTIDFASGYQFNTGGYYRIEVAYTDHANNTTTVVRYLRVDDTRPNIDYTGEGLSSTRADAAWVAHAHITFLIWDTFSGLYSQSAKYGYSPFDWTDDSPNELSSGVNFINGGFYRLEWKARDHVGNMQEVVRWFKIDNTAPTIMVNGANPQQSNTWTKTATVTFSASDSESGIAEVTGRFGYHSDATWPLSSPTTFHSGDTFTQTGCYRLEFHAVNQVGLNALTQVYWLEIDATGPSITVNGHGFFDSQETASWVNSSAVGWSASDLLSGIKESHAAYQFDADNWPGNQAEMVAFSSGTNLTNTGYYRIQVTATDQAENSVQAVRWVKLDKTGPMLYLLGDGVDQNNLATAWQKTTTVTFQPRDVHSGLASSSAKYSLNQRDWPSDSTTDLTSPMTFTTSGYYRIEATGTDALGNASTAVRFFKLDSSAPKISITGTGLATTPSGAAWVNSSTIRFKMDDSFSGIDTQSAMYGYSASGWPSISNTSLSNGQVFSTPGYYRLTVTAADNLKNSASEVRYLKIEAAALTVTVTGEGLAMQPEEALGTFSTTVTFSASGGNQGMISNARYTFSTDTWPTASTTDFSSGQVFTTPGYYRIEITATDQAGATVTEVRWLQIKAPDFQVFLPALIR